MPKPSALTPLRLRPTAALIAQYKARIKRLDALIAEVQQTNAQVRQDWQDQCRREPPF